MVASTLVSVNEARHVESVRKEISLEIRGFVVPLGGTACKYCGYGDESVGV